MDPLLLVIISFGLIFVVTASLGNGLAVTPKSIGGPLRGHRQLNVMLLLSNFIVLPVLLIGLAAIIPFAPQVKMAIIALALCAGAPFIPWLVGLAKGNLGYSVAVVILLTVVTLIVMPFALPWMLNALKTGATPSVWLVAWPMLLFILVPLVIGMVIRARLPQLAGQIGPYLGPISITFLLVHIILFIGFSWVDFKTLMGNGVVAFVFVFPLAGMLIGYLLSPPYLLSPVPPANPHRGSKIVSAVAVAQQNTGAVICCAIFALGKYTVAGDMMLLGAIVTIIVVTLWMAELGRRVEKKQEAAAASPQSNPPAEPAMAPPASL
jgi:bile acid:Na+ symporter, BASS family